MSNWEGFEIVCVDLDEEAEYDDCRAITEIGVLAPSLKKHTRMFAWASLEKRPYWYHLMVNDELVHPVPDRDNGHKFIRVANELTPEDPLLELPSCQQYQMEHQFKSA